jgi:hypothetical protein
MSLQRITIRPDGSAFGLDHKRKGLQLRTLGKAKTTRATLIEWDESRQHWTIEWAIDGPIWKKGQTWGPGSFLEAGVDLASVKGAERLPAFPGARFSDPFVYFEDYEDAVTAEIAVIQALQLLWDTFTWGEGGDRPEADRP